MKAALNLIRKDGGEVLFWGQELTEDAKELKEDIGCLLYTSCCDIGIAVLCQNGGHHGQQGGLIVHQKYFLAFQIIVIHINPSL